MKDFTHTELLAGIQEYKNCVNLIRADRPYLVGTRIKNKFKKIKLKMRKIKLFLEIGWSRPGIIKTTTTKFRNSTIRSLEYDTGNPKIKNRNKNKTN